jgi:alkane 1-monooxygenase
MKIDSAALPWPRYSDAKPAWAAGSAYSVALVLPLCTWLFLATGPHGPLAAILCTLPVWLVIAADVFGPRIRSQSPMDHASWLFDGLLYLLALLQFGNIVAMLAMAAALRWDSAYAITTSLCNLLAMRILVGTTSCCTGIAVAHEMIHRRHAVPRTIGRLLLLTVCYTHFAVEHLRSHHRHVGTPEDPATARFGETYRHYWRRTKWQQLRNAWRIESERLGLDRHIPNEEALVRATRWMHHEILRGLLAQVMVLAGAAYFAGLVGLMIFMLQALAAVRLLEAVNYFQHWGLERSRDGLDTWVTDSWLTHHTFIGLARHADHHRHGARPYYLLAAHCEGPRLPSGYFGTAVLAKSFNRHFQRYARAELLRYRQRPRRYEPPESFGWADRSESQRASSWIRSSGLLTFRNRSGRSL